MKKNCTFSKLEVIPFHLPQNEWKMHKGKPLATTVEDTTIRFNGDGVEYTLFIPAGFKHDGASRPHIASRLIPAFGPSLLGALPHDWLYRTKGGASIGKGNEGSLLNSSGAHVTLTRQACDMVMKAGFRLTFSKWRCDICYRIVRIFGKKHWGGPVPGTK